MNDVLAPQDISMPLRDRDGAAMPFELQIFFDDHLYERMEKLALRMAKAVNVTPKHLIDKPDACFFVIEAAIGWRLRPGAVARATYQTPNGDIGFHGSLINAIIEKSGRLEPGTGGVRYEHFGDWAQVTGKHEIRSSEKGGKYAAATWTDKDAAAGGCGVIIKARLRGEKEDREFSMRLTQAFPRNSTLWATDPATQLVYLATRRFANLRMPGVLMGFRDPIDDAPVYEHDMGEAQVVVGEPEISMPRPRQPEAPAERIDTETGEVQREEPQEAVPDPSGPQLITPAALRILTQKLQHPALTDRFLQHFGIGALEQLPMTQVNAAFAWIAEQPAPAKE